MHGARQYALRRDTYVKLPALLPLHVGCQPRIIGDSDSEPNRDDDSDSDVEKENLIKPVCEYKPPYVFVLNTQEKLRVICQQPVSLVLTWLFLLVLSFCSHSQNMWYIISRASSINVPNLITTYALVHKRQNFQVWHWCVTPSQSYGHIHSTHLRRSWSKVCSTPWKFAMFSSSPLVQWWKRLCFPNLALPPSPHTMLLQWGQFDFWPGL